MSIIIKKLTLKNFMSVGQVAQTIDFDNKSLSLVVGENLDLGGNGSANGVGKSAINNGLSYALFGTAVSSIKRDNLINRTNQKNMSATIEFSVRGTEYKIVRSRKPNNLKFYINDTELVASDAAQGDSRETQEAIERVLSMTSTMFQHIVGLNSYTTPFLSMKVGDQREVIEQLLGITLLSEKAEALKELNRRVKESIQAEDYRVRAIDDTNKRIQEQIDALVRRQSDWQKKHDDELSSLAERYVSLTQIDIDAEITAHGALAEYLERSKQCDARASLIASQRTWVDRRDRDIAELERSLDAKNRIDIVVELEAHERRAAIIATSETRNQLRQSMIRYDDEISRNRVMVEKLQSEISELQSHRCYACGQDFHDANHAEVLDRKIAMRDSTIAVIDSASQSLADIVTQYDALGVEVEMPSTHYNTMSEAIRHQGDVDNLVSSIESKRSEIDPFSDQIASLPAITLGDKPVTFYKTLALAVEHRSEVISLESQITEKSSQIDPYRDQIKEMIDNAIQTIDYTTIDGLNNQLKHQDYLLDLLTNKKSFVRKRIISQNLSYLNARLSHYLTQLGLPHRVVFQDDLSVEITDMGRDADFDSLSSGERNRVILGLSLAFRDVFENLFSPTNLLFIDELMDSGMDSLGIESGLALLKDMVRRRGKSVWLVSHREELRSRVDSLLTVVKENGFTSFNMEESS